MLQFILVGLFSIINNYQILNRFYDSAMEYKQHNIFLEGLAIHQDAVYFTTQKIFSIDDYIENISCFRIPSILTLGQKIIVFSEARINSCKDCSITGIVSKTSYDGIHFSNLNWVIPPTNRSGNFVPLYDSYNKIIIAHYSTGGHFRQNHWDCAPCLYNMEIKSTDLGLTWSIPKQLTIDTIYNGFQPGPGNAAVIYKDKDKVYYFFAAHYLTAYREGGGVLVYYSDDLGKTYQDMHFIEHMDEPTLILWENNLVFNMRTNDGYRGVSIYNLLSKNWSYNYLDPELIDPICEGGHSVIDNILLFTNPNMKYSRSNLTLYYKSSLYMPWNQIQLTNPSVLTDYSVISQKSIKRNGSNYIGVVWGSCRYPFPFRPWCIVGWEIELMYVPLNKLKYYYQEHLDYI
tara:strand:+ start:5901 stop:7106 length:1206 start_codon:yes stop_codon:yes gene_type:complete